MSEDRSPSLVGYPVSCEVEAHLYRVQCFEMSVYFRIAAW